MKKLFSLLFLAIILLQHTKIQAQTSSLAISYTTSEKSKDSHSTSESFTFQAPHLYML
jgi:hypothetical protein